MVYGGVSWGPSVPMEPWEVDELLLIHANAAAWQLRREEEARLWRHKHRWRLRLEALLDLLPFEIKWKENNAN